MVPLAYRVTAASRDTHDTCTLELDPLGAAIEPQPGQFAMLYAWGVGEVPISLSGLTGERLVHTIRDVGAVTHALCGLGPGDDLGVRGPFGNTWPLVEGADHVVVAGGLGLAPLRPAIRALAAEPERYGRVSVLYGARTPDDLLYPREWQIWHERGLDIRVTVDAAAAGWDGTVGVVTKLVERAAFDPGSAVALVCGPEIMMRFASAGARRARPRPGAHVRLARARHEVRHRPLRPLPARPDARLPRRPGLRLERGRALAGGARAVSKPTARRLEVRLLRRLPAEPARLRGRAARRRRAGRDRLLPRGVERDRRGAVRRLDRRGLDHHRARRAPHPGDPRVVDDADRDRRLRDLGRHPGAAQLRGHRRLRGGRLRVARLHLHARHLDAHLGAREGRSRAAGLPDQQAPAARGDRRAARRAQAQPAVRLRLRRVQAARRPVRDGHARRAVPRPGDARRLRRALPGLRARLLRLLRAEGDARTFPRCAPGGRGPLGRDERTVDRALATFNVARFGE